MNQLFQRWAAGLCLALLPSLALAQGTPAFQSGQMLAPHNLAKITRNGQFQDAGGLTGDALGRGVNPFSILDSLGDAFCANTAATTGVYHSLCIGHNASGDPTFKVDGTSYPFLGVGNGNVVGPSPSVSGNVAAFNNLTGTLLKDSGVSLRPNAVANGFSLAQQAMFMAGTYTGSGLGPYAEISVTDTAANPTVGTALVGLRVDHSINSTAGAGNRAAIQAILIQNAQTSGTDSLLKFYHGIFGQAYANANDGGTGTTVALSKGNYYGLAGIGQLQAGATNIQGVFGAELNVSAQAGASVAEKAVLMLIGVNADAVHGSVYDAMLGFTRDGTTSVGFNHGIAFGRPDSTWPIDTANGTLIGVVVPGAGSAIAKYGIDLRNLTVAVGGYQFVGTGFGVDPTGNLFGAALQASGITPSVGYLDTFVGFLGGGQIRYASLGTGAYQYQINTAVGGGFGTVTVAYSVNATGNMIFAQPITLAGGASMFTTAAALTNGAAAQVGTLNNGPVAGNPTKWVAINDAGVTRYIPAW